MLAERAGIVYLQDSGITISGARFWGSPWQPAFNDWAFNLPRGKALAQKWARIPDDTDVLIPHGPPAGFGDQTGYAGNRTGCEDLLVAVERVKPRMHLFGHIHDAGGVWQHGETLIANVTTWESERAPTILNLDLQTKVATATDVPPRRPEPRAV
jgi:hypothetical protein